MALASPDTSATLAGTAAEPGDEPNAERLVRWALSTFPRHRLLITTGFGMEGCALIDLVARQNQPFQVFYFDTHFLFAETHALRARLEARYRHLRLVNAGTSLTPEEQAERVGPELWRTDPDYCCQLRKVEPMRRLARRADAWLTGLRRAQSTTRASLRAVAWDGRYDLLKVNPFAAWSRGDVWSYVLEHDVPYNPLHDQGYPSVGCTHCTHPVPGLAPGEYSRAGRWAGSDKTECGLHLR